MADIKWIKLYTGIFDDEKVKIIESRPEGDSILVIWIKLLVQAGRLNANGYVYLDEKTPYTEESLATVLNRPINTIRGAVKTFMEFGLIENEEGMILIKNWGKYQNVEGMDLIREQTAARVRKFRERKTQKLLPSCNVTCKEGNVTVTQENKNIDKKEIKNKKIPYAENVFMTEDQHQALVDEFGEDGTKKRIEVLSLYQLSTGKRYKNHHATIRMWELKEKKAQNNKRSGEINSDNSPVMARIF